MKLAALLIAISLPLAGLAAEPPTQETKAGDAKVSHPASPKKAAAKPAAPAKKPATAPAKPTTSPAKAAPKKEPAKVYKGSYSTTHEPIRDTQGNVIPTDPNAYDVSSAMGPAKK